MDKNFNRDQFLTELPEFVEGIDWTKSMEETLRKHQYFKQFNASLDIFATKREKVLYILFVMTRERSTCRSLVDLLRDSGQIDAANRLEYLNLSQGPMELTTDIEIPILKVTAPKKDLSNCYNLISKPRGWCIIINNVEDQQSPDFYNKGKLYKPKGLKRETERYKYIFKQLFFMVHVLSNLNAIQMKEKLCEIRKNLKNWNEAFIVIVISHGQNEQVLGYNACEILRKERFGEIKREDMQKAKREIDKDVINIKDIINIFSEENCNQLKSVPKLYFFICCRHKSFESDPFKIQKPEEVEYVKIASPKILDNRAKLDTFVSYACSEGFDNFFNDYNGMSYFGQAFTHSIAQYACDEPLSGIMSRTSTRLKTIYNEMLKSEGNSFSLNVGHFAIEVNTYAMDRQLYFNPGIAEDDCDPDYEAWLINEETNIVPNALTNKEVHEQNTNPRLLESEQINSHTNKESGSKIFIVSNQQESDTMNEKQIVNKKELKSKQQSVIFTSSDKKSRYYLDKNGSIYYINEDNILETGEYNCAQLVNSIVKFDYLFSMKMQSKKSDITNVVVSGRDIYYLNSGSINMTTFEELLDFSSKKCIIDNQIFERSINQSGETNEQNIIRNIIENTEFQGKRMTLGVGAFGEVYKYEKDIYAYKKIKIIDIYSIDKLEKEVEILKICNEKFVVKYFEHKKDKEFFYIKMECCTDNLSKVIEEKAQFFNRDQAKKMGVIEYFILCEIFKEILECVNYLHERKPEPIIHRDLKPQNILIKEKGINGRFIKLCDFGLATFDDLVKTLDHTRNQGTSRYMAPEVQQGTRYRIHADIYSLHGIAMDLYDYKRHDTGSCITDDGRFKEQSLKLEEIIRNMARTDNFRKRPKCFEILEADKEWNVDVGKYIDTPEYNEIFNQKNIMMNNFFVNFFKAKRVLNR